MYNLFISIINGTPAPEILNMRFTTYDKALDFYTLHRDIFCRYKADRVMFVKLTQVEALKYLVAIQRHCKPNCTGYGVYEAFFAVLGDDKNPVTLRERLVTDYRRAKIERLLN